jgi:uncharacterized protein YdhG (YjbR/CyaY superfamily)
MDRSVQGYIDAIPPDHRPLFERLQILILDVCPDAEIVISYQVPTYKAPGGRVSLGVWKDGVSLYTTDPRHIEAFKQRHPSVKTGKASLNFRLSDELPENDVREAVARALQLG